MGRMEGLVMRPSLLLGLLLAPAAWGFAPAPPPRPKKLPDLPVLAGSWRVVRYQSGAQDIMGARELRVRLEKQRWTFLVRTMGAAERTGSRYDLSLDPKASPPAFSWRGADGKSLQYVGSYALDGDTLSIFFASPGPGPDKNRPTNFATPRPGDYLMVLKREPATR
jgi:uncharacterized protein (TIGR03067 family)